MNNTASLLSTAPPPAMHVYQVGDSDQRPWGHYVVTGVGIDDNGNEYCEKTITVKPGQVLSLQSHDLRRENWTVRKGTLTALRDGQRVQVLSRESIHIPVGSIHCMANLEEEDCVVEERQEGVCREEDIKRYMDAYQRSTQAPDSEAAAESLAVYQQILSDLKTMNMNRMQGTPY